MLSIAPLTDAHTDAAVELWQQTGLTRPWNRRDNAEAEGFYAALGYRQDEVMVLSRRLVD